MQSLTLESVAEVAGDIHLPGSKSLSNRAFLLAALAEGKTRIQNLLHCDDTRYMRDALTALGVSIHDEEDACLVTGTGGPLPALDPGAKQLELYLGNAGTAMRPLAAALCLAGSGSYRLSGDPRMHERPIEHLVQALSQLGAQLRYLAEEGFPPLAIQGGSQITGGSIRMPGNISSQYLTSLLMALPMAGGDTNIEITGEQVSKPYLDMTLATLSRFQVHAEHESWQHIHIPGNQKYISPGQFLVEGDASSASYFLAAGAIAGGPVRVHGLARPSLQGDARFIDLLEEVGARVKRGDTWVEVSAGELRAFDLDLNDMPDAAMTAAMLALYAKGPCRIRNVYNWRVKETDRLTAMATELKKLGAGISETRDSITIKPPVNWQGQALDTYEDHRMAMCMSLAAFGPLAVTIKNPGCVAKTFPDYFKELARLMEKPTPESG